MYDNTRDCAKCGVPAASGSADIPLPHLPPVWVRLYAAAGHFAQRSWQIWAETHRHKQHCCRHTEHRTDGKVKQGRTLLSSIVEIDIRQANYIKEN